MSEKSIKQVIDALDELDTNVTEEKPGHKFWNTQPVLQNAADFAGKSLGSIEDEKAKKIRPTPYDLPPGLSWSDLDIHNDDEAQELYVLLRDHYVEDKDAMFRFNYSIDFLRYALTPPGWRKDFHLGVRREGKLVAFISSIPTKMEMTKDDLLHTCVSSEINFLCVDHSLRKVGMAPQLIREMTRRSNAIGIFQGFYTAGVTLPTPFSQARYYHRSIDTEQLINIDFLATPEDPTIRARVIERQQLTPREIEGWRPLTRMDVPQVTVLLSKYLSQFALRPVYDEDEVAHWFIPRGDVVSAYVVERDEKIVAVCSYYNLPSSVLTKGVELKAAYNWYSFAATEEFTRHELFERMFLAAKKEGFHVFNAVDIQDNTPGFMRGLRFLRGDGQLNYYFFNWNVGLLETSQVGITIQ